MIEPAGRTYTPELDAARLETLLYAVSRLMADGQWRTLGEIHRAVKRGSEGGIGARLRDWKKVGYRLNKRRRGDGGWGLYEYQLLPPEGGQMKFPGVPS